MPFEREIERSTGTPTPPRRAATRRSCSRRSTSRRTPSPRRSPTARCAPTASTSRSSTTSCCATSRRIIIVACGTSYHAGLIGRYAIEEWARVPVEMDIASEYRYRNPVVGPGDLVIGITQSGETARHAGRDAARPRARRDGARGHQHHGLAGHARRRRRAVTRAPAWRSASPRPRRSSPRSPVMYLLALRARRAARHAERRAADRAGRAGSSASRTTSPSCSSAARRTIDRVAERHYDKDVLPLPRPPRRAAGVPRGRAEAQGDLLHRDRRVRGGRDEARPDRAARRGHAGRRRGAPTRRCSTRSSPTCRRSASAART